MTDKVKAKFKEWLTDKVGDFPEFTGFSDEIVDMYLSTSHRILYDFFDSERIYLNIGGCDKEFEIEIAIGTEYEPWDEISHKTRIEAEKAGFEKCAELLNEKLCNQK